jgi:hypothetical protein
MLYFSKKITLVISGIVLAASFSYLSANWSGAPSNPPNSNTPAPLNVGSNNQAKQAGLILSSLWANGIIVATSSLPVNLKAVFGGRVGATEYCDQNGANCASAQTLGSGGSSCYVAHSGSTTQTNNNSMCLSGFTNQGYLGQFGVCYAANMISANTGYSYYAWNYPATLPATNGGVARPPTACSPVSGGHGWVQGTSYLCCK